VRYITPFKKEEACKLIEDFQVPKKFSLSAETVYNEITGGVPRQIALLREAKDVKRWREVQEQSYFTLAKRTFSEMSADDRASFVSFLDQLFGPSPKVPKPPSVWYDKSLFYIMELNTLMLNPMTESAVFTLWTQHLQREAINKPGRTGSEMGAVFEREVIKGFIHLSHIELHPFYMIKSPMVPGILKVSRIERIIYFDGEKDVPRLPTLECRLLKPKSQIFKAWDFIIEDAHTKQIVFVQVTTQYPDVHDKSKDGNSKMASAFLSFEFWKWKDVLVAGRETISTLKLYFTKEQTKENKHRNKTK